MQPVLCGLNVHMYGFVQLKEMFFIHSLLSIVPQDMQVLLLPSLVQCVYLSLIQLHFNSLFALYFLLFRHHFMIHAMI